MIEYLLEGADGGRDVVQLAGAVVGHDDAGRAVLHGEPRVFCSDHSLHQDRQRGDGLQPLHILPAQGAIDLPGDVRSQS
jgi:hypothetical protein